MGNSMAALTFVVFVNLFLAIAQFSMDQIDLGANTTKFMNINSTIFADSQKGDVLDNSISEVEALYPEAALVTPSSGTEFTDVVNTIKAWYTTFINYAFTILTGPYNMLKYMGLPTAFAALIGFAWWTLTAFVLFSFFVRGD